MVPLDLHKDVVHFTKIMDYFRQAKPKWLGYDCHTFTVTGQCWDPDAQPEAMDTYDHIGKLFISTGAFHPHTHHCNLLTQLMLGLYGKGTHVFAMQEKYALMTSHVVIKD